jgi:hypothetical protein
MVRAPLSISWSVALFLASCSEPAPPVKPPAPASPVRITQFYASPAKPPKGQKTLVCYGVENATEVQLDPPIEKVWPALSHCFDLVPVKDVTYTLTALRGTERVSQSITVKPGPPAVRLLEVSISQIEIALGGNVTVCFKAADAVDVAIRPGEWIPPHSFGVGCVGDQPRRSTAYTVTATGAAGDTVSQKVTVKVR